MTQGIRKFTNEKFAELLPQFQTGTLTGTAFRAAVMLAVVEAFNISTNSAATHYNHSLKVQRATDPKSVENLGRAEDKKGGRKLQHPVDLIKVKDGTVVATGISRAKATEMIAKAASKKQAKLKIANLKWAEDHPVVAPVETPTEEPVAQPAEVA